MMERNATKSLDGVGRAFLFWWSEHRAVGWFCRRVLGIFWFFGWRGPVGGKELGISVVVFFASAIPYKRSHFTLPSLATMASSSAASTSANGKKRRRKTRLDKDARIVIIGSGLGGLSAAISLEQAGFTKITVMERDASASSRREGYGLTLTYNPKGPLAQMGLLEEVAQRDCPSRSHYMFSVRYSITHVVGARGVDGDPLAFLFTPSHSCPHSLTDPFWDIMGMTFYQIVARVKEAICASLDKHFDKSCWIKSSLPCTGESDSLRFINCQMKSST